MVYKFSNTYSGSALHEAVQIVPTDFSCPGTSGDACGLLGRVKLDYDYSAGGVAAQI